MKDQIDVLNEEREQRLLRDIRQELRHARMYRALMAVSGLLLALFAGFGLASDSIDMKAMQWLLLGFAIVALAAARIPQRDRLLKKAGDKLAAKD